MRLREVIVNVGDVDKAIEFYTKVVGLTHVRTVQEQGHKVAELEADGQRVTLVPAGAAEVLLAFEADSVTSRQRRLRRHGVKLGDDVPVEVAGGVWLPFTDPWGNRLGYWEDRPPDPEGPGDEDPPGEG